MLLKTNTHDVEIDYIKLANRLNHTLTYMLTQFWESLLPHLKFRILEKQNVRHDVPMCDVLTCHVFSACHDASNPQTHDSAVHNLPPCWFQDQLETRKD